MKRVRSFFRELGALMTWMGDAYVEGEIERYRRKHGASTGAKTGPR